MNFFAVGRSGANGPPHERNPKLRTRCGLRLVNGEAVPREDCFPNTKIPHLREVFPVKKPPTTGQDLDELTMKIFVADDSAMVGERMIRLLSELSRIEVVGQVHDALAAFDAICEATK